MAYGAQKQYQGEERLLADLKSGEFKRVYLLFGEEDYLKEYYENKIIRKIVAPEFSAFNLTRLDGKKFSADQLADAAEALPLMAPLRCVVVDDLEPEKFSPGEAKKMEQILLDPPESCVILLRLAAKKPDPKKSARVKNLISQVEKVGAVVDLAPRDRSRVIKFAMARCEKEGCSLSSQLAGYLIDRCSQDMWLLSGELAKLCAYVGEGEITKEAIDRVTTQAVDAGVYDLSRMILKGDYAGSLRILSDLFYLREEPTVILSTLSYTFVDLYRARIARDTGKDAAQVTGDFGYRGREFRVKNAMRDASRYSPDFLRKALEILTSADYQLKSSRADSRLVVEQAVTQLFYTLQKEGIR